MRFRALMLAMVGLLTAAAAPAAWISIESRTFKGSIVIQSPNTLRTER